MAQIIKKTGKSYNIFDKINNVWNKCSFWTSSDDVEFDDGLNASTKLSAINGITSDLACEDESIAASAAALNQVNRNFVSNIYVGDDGKLHKVQGGADSVLPFSSIKTQTVTQSMTIDSNKNATMTLTFNELSEVIGISNIENTSDATVASFTNGRYHDVVSVNGLYTAGKQFSINGNIVTFKIYNYGNNGTSSWSVTAIGK